MKFRFGEKRKNQMVAFGSIMPDVINDLNLKESFFIENIKDMWESYVGRTLSVHSVPDRIFKKTLFVKVDHSAYANELSLHSNTILNSLKRDIGPEFIYNIKFEVIKKSRYGKQ